MSRKVYSTRPEEEFATAEKCHIIEILNNQDAENLSISRARVEPGVSTELHRLSGIEEFYYILQGRGIVELETSFKKVVSKGDVVHIRAGVPQRITNTSDVDLIFLCICTPRFLQDSYTSVE